MAQADFVEMQPPKGDYAAVNTTSSSGNTDSSGRPNRDAEYAQTDGSGGSTLRVSLLFLRGDVSK